MYLIFLLIFCTSAGVFAARSTGCYLNVYEGDEKNSPLLLVNVSSTLEFIIPKEGSIYLRNNDKIVFACPDARNSLTFSNKSIAVAVCTGDGTLRIVNTHVKFEDVQCKKTIRGEVSDTRESCGDGEGHIYEIGYQITRKDWLPLFEVCYDNDRGIALYAEHTVIGQEIKSASKSNYRPSFSSEGLGRQIPASVVYKRSYQKANFNKLFRSARTAERFINSKSFLSRGHLAPDADFLFAPWQYTTYYYLNTAPQWQTINAGNWKRIENSVRNLAAKLAKSLRIFTGTYGILELPDENNNDVLVYLTYKKVLPVPKYMWKIIYDEESRRAIVLVISNNPFVRGSRDDYLCENVCEESGWNQVNYRNYEQGFVHCCEYREFVSVVETAPRISVKGLLQNE